MEDTIWVRELGLTSYITALIRLFRTQAQAGLGRRYEKEKTVEGEKKDMQSVHPNQYNASFQDKKSEWVGFNVLYYCIN